MKILVIANPERAKELLESLPELRGFRHMRKLGTMLEELQEGDIIAGQMLPYYLVAEISRRGAIYWDLRRKGTAMRAGWGASQSTLIEAYSVRSIDVVRTPPEGLGPYFDPKRVK